MGHQRIKNRYLSPSRIFEHFLVYLNISRMFYARGCVVDDVAAAAAADSYSQVNDVASSVSAATSQVANPTAAPVYAVVSRSRAAPSQTNPATASSNSSSAAAAAAAVDARRDLYTRVIRRQDGRRPAAASQRAVSGPSTRVDLGSDGYASIDEPVQRQSTDPQHYNSASVDFYDVIRDDDLSMNAGSSSDFDPSYESVPQTAAAARGHSSVVSVASANSAAPTSSSGLRPQPNVEVSLPATTARHPSTSTHSTHRTDGSAAAGQRQRPNVEATVSVVSDNSRQSEPTAGRHRHHQHRGGFLVREHIYDEVTSPATTSAARRSNTHSDKRNTHTDV